MLEVLQVHAGHLLFRLQPFRLLCIWAVSHGVAVDWIGRNTPMFPRLHQFFLDREDWAGAAAMERASREFGHG